MTWNIDYPKKKERNKERKQQQQQQKISNRHLYSINTQSTKTNIVIIKLQLFTNKDTAKNIYIYINNIIS